MEVQRLGSESQRFPASTGNAGVLHCTRLLNVVLGNERWVFPLV